MFLIELKCVVPKASYTDRRMLKTKITGEVMFFYLLGERWFQILIIIIFGNDDYFLSDLLFC